MRGRGVIDTEHGRGSFVAQLGGAERLTPLMHLFSSQPRALFDLLEVRALLEGESERLAALRATDVDRLLIKRCYEEMVDAHETSQPRDAREGRPTSIGRS